jgi:hypothetical protein
VHTKDASKDAHKPYLLTAITAYAASKTANSHFGKTPITRCMQQMHLSSDWTTTAKVGQSELKAQPDLDPDPTTTISPTKTLVLLHRFRLPQ